jgi:hypothetical protein
MRPARYALPQEILFREATKIDGVFQALWLREINKVNYQAAPGSFNFHNKREIGRILLCLQLVETYNYPLQQIRIEVLVPTTHPRQRADVVVYTDEERKQPFIVFECLKPGAPHHELNRSVLRVINQAKILGATLAVVTSGSVRKIIKVAECRGAMIPRTAWQEDWPARQA